MNFNLFAALSLVALCSGTAAAQQFQAELVPAEAFEKYEQPMDLPLRHSVGARFEVTRTEVHSSDLPAPYDLDQWVTGEVASMLEDPTNLRMIIDEKPPAYTACTQLRCCGGRPSLIDILLASKPYQLKYERSTASKVTSKGNRYDNNPAPDFVIIDLAEGEHLGMVPGHWGP